MSETSERPDDERPEEEYPVDDRSYDDPPTRGGRLWWLAWPVGYFAYALLRGQASGFYPYYFIDVGQLGIARVLLYAGGLLIAFLAAAHLLRALAHWRRGTRAQVS